ncbi:MAG: hypothetical protein FJX76_25730 [Armatimonadetes bacterium]|nr:hypothetical protein [Armatimonadota bacterium]
MPPSPVPPQETADLAIHSVVRATHLVWPNYHYRLKVTVRNLGGGPSLACRLKYELQPQKGAKGGTYAGTIAVPAMAAGESLSITSDAIPYSFKGKYNAKLWLVLPDGSTDPQANNVRIEKYQF